MALVAHLAISLVVRVRAQKLNTVNRAHAHEIGENKRSQTRHEKARHNRETSR